jgi:hypothetical protein
MRGTNCGDKGLESFVKLNNINLLNGGCETQKKLTLCWWEVWDPNKLYSHCRQSQADAVFMFLTVVVLLACLAMTFLHNKR